MLSNCHYSQLAKISLYFITLIGVSYPSVANAAFARSEINPVFDFGVRGAESTTPDIDLNKFAFIEIGDAEVDFSAGEISSSDDFGLFADTEAITGPNRGRAEVRYSNDFLASFVVDSDIDTALIDIGGGYNLSASFQFDEDIRAEAGISISISGPGLINPYTFDEVVKANDVKEGTFNASFPIAVTPNQTLEYNVSFESYSIAATGVSESNSLVPILLLPIVGLVALKKKYK